MNSRVKRAARELLGATHWQPKPHSFEEQIYCLAVRRGDVCYDIGSNVGDVAVLLARLAGPEGTVVAFEPLWPAYMKLCERAQRSPHARAPIITVPLGLADEEKIATIQVPNGDFGYGSMASAHDWSSALPGATIDSYECRFRTLDAFIESSKLPPPSFVKIDVEGAELFVLRGARELLARGHRPLMLIELFAPWQRAFNYGPFEVLSLLSSVGFRFLFACPTGLVEHQPTEREPFPEEYASGYNVLAFCPGTHDQRIDALTSLRAGGGTPILSMPPPPVPNKIG